MGREWKCCQPFLLFFPSFFTTLSIALLVTGRRGSPNYLKRRIRSFAHHCLDFSSFCTAFLLFYFHFFFLHLLLFMDLVDRQMACAPDKEKRWFFFGGGTVSNPAHHLRQTYSLPPPFPGKILLFSPAGGGRKEGRQGKTHWRGERGED